MLKIHRSNQYLCKENIKCFKYFGRDIEIFFTKCKISHAKRVLYEPLDKKKSLNESDIQKAMDIFIKETSYKNNSDNQSFFSMYC